MTCPPITWRQLGQSWGNFAIHLALSNVFMDPLRLTMVCRQLCESLGFENTT